MNSLEMMNSLEVLLFSVNMRALFCARARVTVLLQVMKSFLKRFSSAIIFGKRVRLAVQPVLLQVMKSFLKSFQVVLSYYWTKM